MNVTPIPHERYRFYVQGSEGTYVVDMQYHETKRSHAIRVCTCADFLTRAKDETGEHCKHILAVADYMAHPYPQARAALEKAVAACEMAKARATVRAQLAVRGQ